MKLQNYIKENVWEAPKKIPLNCKLHKSEGNGSIRLQVVVHSAINNSATNRELDKHHKENDGANENQKNTKQKK